MIIKVNANEQDERFASGPWKGVWTQQGGKGEMDLHLEFREGRISGHGADRAAVARIDGQGMSSVIDARSADDSEAAESLLRCLANSRGLSKRRWWACLSMTRTALS